ncbi:MAG: TonB-dependent receptor [Sulfuritalea sp.]|jgi:vitamin B12 transporter|nr:TonB-dependent receptor [Sulfuritalea sp.]
MYKCFAIAACAASLVFPCVSLAADDLAAVVVTATRQATRINEVIADVTLIDRESIEQAGSSTIGELLARQPGLQVVSTGGPGAATTVFIRGANSGHTLLLVDGQRFGSSTTGQPAFETIPLSHIERIEILRGPAGAVYGADAIGGVIQIFTRRGEGVPSFDAYAGVGSQGTVEGTAGFSGSKDGLSFSVRGGSYRTLGFDALGTPPDRDGFHQNHVSASVGLKLNGGGDVAGNLFQSSGVNKYDAGTPFDNRINKKAGVYGLSWTQPVTANWTSTVRAGQSVDDAATIDPTNPSVIITKNDQFVWQNDIRLPVGKALLAYEMLREGVTSTLSALTVDHRRTDSLLAGWTGSFSNHRIQINARHDDSTQYGKRNTGSVSYGYQFSPDWRGYIASGRGFKAPTFNDLYFPLMCFPPFGCFGGNPNLRPEQARNREAGLTWERGQSRIGIVRFDNKISDLIVWTAQPFNVGNASLRGTTLSYDLNTASWQAGLSYTGQEARDDATGLPLFRRADRQLAARLAWTGSGWRIGTELQSVGRRDDFDFTNNVRVKLGGYSIVNAFMHHTLSHEWTLEARANNLGGRKYQQALNFAAPTATLFVGFRYAPK